VSRLREFEYWMSAGKGWSSLRSSKKFSGCDSMTAKYKTREHEGQGMGREGPEGQGKGRERP